MNGLDVKGFFLYSVALCFTCLSMFLQLMPLNAAEHFQTALGLSKDQIIDLMSLYFVAYALMQIPCGIIFDNFGIKKILPIWLFFLIVGTALSSFSTNSYTFAIGRLLTGFGCSVSYISGVYIASSFFPANRVPFFIGLLEVAGICGAILAAAPFQYLLEKYGWLPVNFLIIGVLISLFIVVIMLTKGLELLKTDSVMNFKKMYLDIIGLFKIIPIEKYLKVNYNLAIKYYSNAGDSDGKTTSLSR